MDEKHNTLALKVTATRAKVTWFRLWNRTLMLCLYLSIVLKFEKHWFNWTTFIIKKTREVYFAFSNLFFCLCTKTTHSHSNLISQITCENWRVTWLQKPYPGVDVPYDQRILKYRLSRRDLWLNVRSECWLKGKE